MGYRPLQRAWDLDAMFAGVVRRPGIDLGSEGSELAQRLWTDLVAEYDARLLQAELERCAAAGVSYSESFRAFVAAWAQDEAKHTDALVRIYSLAIDESEASIRARLAERVGDFAPLTRWLHDEFALSVMLAYDEAMSTRAYGDDIPFYGELGRRVCDSGAFGDALRELKNDEAIHYRNAVELLYAEHRERGSDVDGVMEEIVRFDGDQAEYGNTFLLDHATSQFSKEQMVRVGDAVATVIKRRFARSP